MRTLQPLQRPFPLARLLFPAVPCPCAYPLLFPWHQGRPHCRFPHIFPFQGLSQRQTGGHRRRTRTETDTSPGRPEHASRSMTHDPHLCKSTSDSPRLTPLHSTPGSLRVKHPHTHNLHQSAASCNLQHHTCTRNLARTHGISVQSSASASTTDRRLFLRNHFTHLKHPTNALRQAFSTTQALLPPPMRPNL